MSMKGKFPETRWPRLRSFWRKFFDSTNKAVSRGAANISKIISLARKDNWRRKEKKK